MTTTTGPLKRMRVYAGIDEAGYGPMFGPLVVARSVFEIDGDGWRGHDAGPPDLWKLLGRAVCRKASDRRRRVAVDDSKKLYSPAAGLGRLERGVLALAPWADDGVRTLEELLEHIGHDEASRLPDLLWYSDGEGGPALPRVWTAEQVGIARAMVRRAAGAAGVRAAELSAAVVYEDRFNRIVEQTRSKGRCAWTFIAHHLWAVWERFGERHPWVVVDRQGGRKVYHELLQLLFDGAELRLLDESDDVSRYHIQRGGRAMTVSFETDSDGRHLPAALASMAAKYMRELLMIRFNRFWRRLRPGVRPTAGYVKDGRRFLADIEPIIHELDIDRAMLVRRR